MKIAYLLAVLFGVATICLSQQSEVSLVTPSGEPFSLAMLEEGRWALAFVVVPNCPACEEVMGWFNRAAEAFPEIRFVLVFPETSPAAESFSSEGVNVLLDEGGNVWVPPRGSPCPYSGHLRRGNSRRKGGMAV